jgi:hypothetical protein
MSVPDRVPIAGRMTSVPDRGLVAGEDKTSSREVVVVEHGN